MRAQRWRTGAALILLLSVVLLIYKGVSSQVMMDSPYLQRDLTVGGEHVRVDIADTQLLRERGLSGRTRLIPRTGMLFVFPTDGHYAFWMKDMSFSIDMLWLASDGTIVGYFENVAPETYPKSFAPEGIARYVLELPGGYVLAHGVKVGDAVGLSLKFL